MGNVIMKARQIQHGATNVEEALNLLSPQELIEMSKRMDAIEAWKSKVRDSVNTGANSYAIDNALKVPVKALSLNMLPIQSGTGDPSPTNIRPISGRTEVKINDHGFNWWDEEWEIGSINPDTGATEPNAGRIRSKNYVPVLGGVTYYYKCPSTSNCRIAYYNASKQHISGSWALNPNTTFTTPSNCAYIKFSPNDDYGTTYNNNICINVSDASINGQYEPYITPVTLTIALGQTVYGGNLDVKTGVLTITHAYTTITEFTGKSGSTTNNAYYKTIADIKRILETEMPNIYSDKYKAMPYNTVTAGDISNGIGVNQFGNVVIGFGLSSEIDTLEKANTWATANPIQLCYELVTPTTIQLTGAELKMLKGYNLISTGADSMDVTALVLGGEA